MANETPYAVGSEVTVERLEYRVKPNWQFGTIHHYEVELVRFVPQGGGESEKIEHSLDVAAGWFLVWRINRAKKKMLREYKIIKGANGPVIEARKYATDECIW